MAGIDWMNSGMGGVGGAGPGAPSPMGPMQGGNMQDPAMQAKLMEYMASMAQQEPMQQGMDYKKEVAKQLRQSAQAPSKSYAGVANSALAGYGQGMMQRQALEGGQDMARKRMEEMKRLFGAAPGSTFSDTISNPAATNNAGNSLDY